jgi:hypothetical protein
MALRRVTITVEAERFKRMNKLIRYGVRGALVGSLLDLIMDTIERDGESIVGYILDGKIDLVRKPDAGT